MLRLIDTNLAAIEDELDAVRLKFGHVYTGTRPSGSRRTFAKLSELLGQRRVEQMQ